MDGTFRKIDVKVKRPGVKLRARRGYLAPTAGERAALAKPAAAKPDPDADTRERALRQLDGEQPRQRVRIAAGYGWPDAEPGRSHALPSPGWRENWMGKPHANRSGARTSPWRSRLSIPRGGPLPAPRRPCRRPPARSLSTCRNTHWPLMASRRAGSQGRPLQRCVGGTGDGAPEGPSRLRRLHRESPVLSRDRRQGAVRAHGPTEVQANRAAARRVARGSGCRSRVGSAARPARSADACAAGILHRARRARSSSDRRGSALAAFGRGLPGPVRCLRRAGACKAPGRLPHRAVALEDADDAVANYGAPGDRACRIMGRMTCGL